MTEIEKTLDRPQRMTLHDLARHAGVSRATVSLVLRKSPLVAEKTRAAVLESMRALGYVYNRGAANLRTQRSHTIGVSINEITNPYFTELTAAIQSAFLNHGRTVFIANSEEDPARQDQFIATMREYNADGLAICPSRGTSRETLRRLKAQGVACVLVSRDIAGSGLDYAGHANEAGMCEAVEHLIGLGHRRIAMIGGNDLVSTGRERRAGHRKALERHGIAVDPRLVVEGDAATRSFGAATVKHLLTLDEPPTAAVCFNDVIAFGVMLGLRQVGKEPGRDFAVVGYDDLAEAELWMPALSTVRNDTVALGAAAAQLLLDRIEAPDAPARRIVLAPKLVLRESSCPPR
ncbi:substrate-binding domain-containing protein [Phreatobacter aquaticus]|uniref:Substrate-binding domain-containing protein n=1 Tax=Phreatobacter aquaticus TaxID=2570229 RepID=A0A4D7QHK5_9HYPH|nr:LacI family DNA-binding transcriptional regulator [Phreatobacter aquaticus]QCK84906.1 substrate-binding domain-containing protein [Phreatobacter aquaticus]